MWAINTRTVTPLTKYKQKHQNRKKSRTQCSAQDLPGTGSYCDQVQTLRLLYLDSSRGNCEVCGGRKTKDHQRLNLYLGLWFGSFWERNLSQGLFIRRM